MTDLWTPPGADLGEFDGPKPDARMQNFIGGLDECGHALPMTYRRGREAADGWIITKATPEGPANLLKTARDMFALGFYAYELVACSNAWAIFGLEAALRIRLDEDRSANFSRLLKQAKTEQLIDEELAEVLEAGRQLRNNFVHEGTQPTWTLGMAGGVIGTSFKIVAGLFPDYQATPGDPPTDAA